MPVVMLGTDYPIVFSICPSDLCYIPAFNGRFVEFGTDDDSSG